MHYIERLVYNGKPVENKEAKEKILDIANKTWEEITPIIDREYPTFSKKFLLKLNPRLRRTGGNARIESSGYMEVNLNERLLAENLEQVRMVVIHEVAHLIQYSVFKGRSRGHDRKFKEIMETLGCKPTRTHSMDTSKFERSRKTMHEYSCDCEKTHIVTTVKHNWIQKGRRRYCVKCKVYLENYVGPVNFVRALIGSGWVRLSDKK